VYNVLKNFDWRLTVKDDARPVIESPLRFGYLAFSDGIKVDAFREILADKAIDILNGTALPRAMRITKVNGDLGGEGEGGMLGHFTTVVVGEGLAQVRRQALEGPGQGAGDAFGVFGRA
jgi:hypothetical protein